MYLITVLSVWLSKVLKEMPSAPRNCVPAASSAGCGAENCLWKSRLAGHESSALPRRAVTQGSVAAGGRPRRTVCEENISEIRPRESERAACTLQATGQRVFNGTRTASSELPA